MTYFILFLIGLSFGSFLNVLIDRIPAGRSVLFGRSRCDFCKKQLSPIDLIPVFSYIFLLGKCRYCNKSLSLQYPIMELLVGLLFVFLYILEKPAYPFQMVTFSVDALLVSLGFALTVMDMKYHIIFDKLLIPFAFFAFFRIILSSPISLPVSLFIGFLSSLPLLLIFLITKGKGMGFGDVKLIFILGTLLGFPNILICYYCAFLTGAVVGVILILRGKKQFRNAKIAFGPFLLLGAVIATLFGNTIWQYTKLFLGF